MEDSGVSRLGYIQFIIYLGGILGIRYDHFGQPQTSIVGAFFRLYRSRAQRVSPKG